MKAVAKCPSCGHEIAATEAVETFEGKGWKSEFLSNVTFDLAWTIDNPKMEIHPVVDPTQEVTTKAGTTFTKQKSHLHKWKVVEKDTAPSEVTVFKPDPVVVAALSASPEALAAYLGAGAAATKPKPKPKATAKK